MLYKRCWLSLFLLLYVCTVYLLFQHGCKDPHDFMPSEDTLLFPPDPPQPLAPVSGFVYMIEDQPFNTYVECQWTAVEAAEEYQFEYTIDTFAPIFIVCDTNAYTIFIKDTTGRRCNHYWRVQAGSSRWKWTTEWSVQWQFELRQRPYGPPLFSPQDSSLFTTDSFPASIELQWGIISDEEFYDVTIMKGSAIVDETRVTENNYVVQINDTGLYNWKVRAGSSYWLWYSHWSGPWFFQIRMSD